MGSGAGGGGQSANRADAVMMMLAGEEAPFGADDGIELIGVKSTGGGDAVAKKSGGLKGRFVSNDIAEEIEEDGAGVSGSGVTGGGLSSSSSAFTDMVNFSLKYASSYFAAIASGGYPGRARPGLVSTVSATPGGDAGAADTFKVPKLVRRVNRPNRIDSNRIRSPQQAQP